MWTYQQSTGKLSHNGVYVATGYAGLPPAGKNNPAAQALRGVGPIPQGRWEIGQFQNTAQLGIGCMPLLPEEGTETFGRSGFWIHGDSKAHPGAASHGCIVLYDPTVRQAIGSSDDHELEVIA